MAVIRNKDTKPEVAIRRALHACGLRFRINAPPVRGLRRTADIVFGPARVAVMVDGCFWHGCPDHYRPASVRSEFWQRKVEENQARDRDTDRKLTNAGWLVIRVWEHEPVAQAAMDISAAVKARHPARESS